MFLAIIVESFLAVKQRNEASFVELSLLEDILCIGLYRMLSSYYDWPSHAEIMHHLHSYHHEDWPINAAELMTKLGMTEEAAKGWLLFYYRILGDPILSSQMLKVANP